MGFLVAGGVMVVYHIYGVPENPGHGHFISSAMDDQKLCPGLCSGYPENLFTYKPGCTGHGVHYSLPHDSLVMLGPKFGGG